MPLGINQLNCLAELALDIWEDKIFFNEKEYPAGFFATEILNRSIEENTHLLSLGGIAHRYIELFRVTGVLEPQLQNWAMAFLRELESVPPFSHLELSYERDLLRILTAEGNLKILRENALETEETFLFYMGSYARIAQAVVNYSTVAKTLEGLYLTRLAKANETHYARALYDCFHNEELMNAIKEYELTDEENFSLTPEIRMSYVFVRHPKHEEETVFASRFMFSRLVDFYSFDLFNGLRYGHAPCQCHNCGRYFLSTNRHKAKYCNGIAPQDGQYTCREYGAKMHQKENNENHPVYITFKTCTNTIRKHHERGEIDDDLRREALRLVEEYRDRALMDKDYEKDGYQKDMERDHIYAVARERPGRNAVC